MRAKKSSSADLNKKSSFYLAIGLFLVLLVSWRAIEWKNYDDDLYGYVALDVDDDDDEEIPITEQLKTSPLQLLKMYRYSLDVKEYQNPKEELAFRLTYKSILTKTLDTPKSLRKWVYRVGFLFSL